MGKTQNPGLLTLCAEHFQRCHGTKPLRSHPPRAVNGRHRFKGKSPPRERDFQYQQEGRDDVGEHEVLRREAGQLLRSPRLSLLGFTHETLRSRALLPAKGNKLSGGRGPICSDETLPYPDLPLVSFQGISWRKDKQQLNHSCRNNQF